MSADINFNKMTIADLMRLPKKTKLIVLSCIGVAVFILIFLVLNLPRINKLSNAKTEERTLKLQLVGLFPQALSIKEQAKEIKQLEQFIKERNDALPKAEELRDILEKLTKMAANNQLNLLLLKPQASRQEQFYIDIPIEMKVEGSYAQLTKFAAQLSKMDDFIAVDSIKMEPSPVDKNAPANNLLTMDLVTGLYYFSPKPEDKKRVAHGEAH